MDVLKTNDSARSRKNESILLQRLADLGNESVAQDVGVDASTISRMKEKEIPRFAKMVAALGLKIVPESMKCYPEKHVENLHYFAELGMKISPDDAAKMAGIRFD